MPSESRYSIPIILSPPIPDVPVYVYSILYTYKKRSEKNGKKISLYKVKTDTATKNIRITMMTGEAGVGKKTPDEIDEGKTLPFRMTVIVDCFEGVKRKRFFSHNTQIGPAFFLVFFAVYYINASSVCLVNSRSVDLTRKATSEKSHTEDSSINIKCRQKNPVRTIWLWRRFILYRNDLALSPGKSYQCRSTPIVIRNAPAYECLNTIFFECRNGLLLL